MILHKMLLASVTVLLLSLTGVCADALPTFQAGINVLLYRLDYATTNDLDSKLGSFLDRMQSDHINAISLSFLIYTEGVKSNRLLTGDKTPSDEDLELFIRRARERGLSVMLRPILDEQSLVAEEADEWRGSIEPSNVSAWFESYGDLLFHYADIAQVAGANSLDIATELNSMEQYPTRWRALVAMVRKRFSGMLTYSSNQGISVTMPWNVLDFVSVDAFFELDTGDTATTKDMAAAWKKWVGPIASRSKILGKPLMLTEIGSTSQVGAHRRSWVWDHKSAVDLEDQRRYYESACLAWKPNVSGIYWWVATLSMPADPTHDIDFTPFGKPAEKEISSCYNQ
ncbi:MAG TPA: hypothetical protein VG753_00750 [Candidatus Paceibacterota bacterium]|nr:hypothetical protein [Candidatus Paceibacterota bacterium]